MVTLLDVSAVAGHHAMPAALLFKIYNYHKTQLKKKKQKKKTVERKSLNIYSRLMYLCLVFLCFRCPSALFFFFEQRYPKWSIYFPIGQPMLNRVTIFLSAGSTL